MTFSTGRPYPRIGVLRPQVSAGMTSTMSVGASHGSPLHGLALDLFFRINCVGSRSDPEIWAAWDICTVRLLGSVVARPSRMDQAGAVCSQSIVDSLNMGTNGSAPGSTRGGA